MKLNIITIITIALLFSSISTANAQQDISIIVPEIENPPDCNLITLSGDRAWIPFEIRTFYDFNRDAKLENTQVGNSNPITTKTPRTYFFTTNAVDEYNVKLDLTYEVVKLRAVKIQIVSAGDIIAEEIIPYTNGQFCKSWHIITSKEPILPTLEEVYGRAVVTMIEEVPNFVPAFEKSIINTSNALAFIALGIVMMLLFGVINMIVFLSRKKSDRRQKQEVKNLQNLSQKNIRETRELMEDVTKFTKDQQRKNEGFQQKCVIEINSVLLEMKRSHDLFIQSMDIEKVKFDSKFMQHEIDFQEKKARLDEKLHELDTILNIEDKSVLRNILNQIPTTNLRVLGKMFRGDTSDKAKTIIKMVGDLIIRRGDTKSTEEGQVVGDELIPAKVTEEIPHDEELVRPDQIEEKCVNCKKKEHCDGQVNTCNCECCYENLDTSSDKWKGMYPRLDYNQVTEEWKRIIEERPADSNDRIKGLEKRLTELKNEETE